MQSCLVACVGRVNKQDLGYNRDFRNLAKKLALHLRRGSAQIVEGYSFFFFFFAFPINKTQPFIINHGRGIHFHGCFVKMELRVEPIEAYLVNLPLSLIVCSGLQWLSVLDFVRDSKVPSGRLALVDLVMCAQY